MKNKNKAIFWDRDGVLSHVIDRGEYKNVGPQKFEDLKLVAGVGSVLEQIKLAGYLNIVATNQPDVARNIISWEELNRMHDYLKSQAPDIIAIYVCPHKQEDGCACRKPKPGMLLDAAKDYHLDLAKCFMVGDNQKDIDVARNAGAKGILKRADYNSNVENYDFKVNCLEEVLQIIK